MKRVLYIFAVGLAVQAVGCGAADEEGDDSADYPSDVKAKAKNWGAGVAATFTMTNETSKKSLTFVTAYREAPHWNDKLKQWVVPMRAIDDGAPTATFLLGVEDLKPGRYTGSESKSGCTLALGVGPNWDPEAEAVGWSNNSGGYCEIELRAAARPGHLEGEFKAKLAPNGSDGAYRLESGYIYIAR
ncbi:hypothetical protein BH09MYX1_BH09MYX1_55220 [soil metagenome]